jgi:dihydrofolate reductase
MLPRLPNCAWLSVLYCERLPAADRSELYRRQARARRLVITEVALDAEGEARFPPIDTHAWREISRETGERGPRDDANFAFVSYERRR